MVETVTNFEGNVSRTSLAWEKVLALGHDTFYQADVLPTGPVEIILEYAETVCWSVETSLVLLRFLRVETIFDLG